MKLGAQLYTVRDFTQTTDDFAETLKKVADIGYRTVQVSGTCAFEAEWLAEQLAANDLTCAITHTAPQRIAEETEAVIREHQIFGCRHIGIGMAPNGMERADWCEAFIRNYQPVAKKIAASGALLMYHNHNIEFARAGAGREVLLDRIAEAFAPEELGITLDTYWVQAGGGDPAQWLRKLHGRVPCIHLKDMAFVPGSGFAGTRMAPVYEGNMNFDAILAAAEEAGTEYLLVEQDDCYGEDPFACLAKSYENLKAVGLA